MSHRNPTFIIKNGEGSSYLFRTIIPQDVRSIIQENSIKTRNSKEIRISLLTGLKSEAIRLAQLLKIKADLIFDNIRSGNISGYCVKTIKVELKAYLYRIRSSGHNGDQIIEESRGINFQYYHQPMERKLTEDYIRCLKFEDFEGFCIAHDIEFNTGDYPKKGLQLQRLILSKKVDEEIGYHSFATTVARDVLNDYLPDLDFEAFRDFFRYFDIDDTEFLEIYDPLGDLSIEGFVALLEKEHDIIPIARKIGVKRLFRDRDDAEKNVNEENELEALEKIWNGLKSPEKPSNDAQIFADTKTATERQGKGKRLSVVFEEYVQEMVSAGAWNPKSELEKRSTLKGLVEIVGDLPVDSLSYETGREYKNKLVKLPANRNKVARYRDLTVDEILKLDDVTPMSVRTVNNNLATVIAFMNWSKKQGYLRENYFEGLKLKSDKQARDERKPFSDDELKRVFDPDVYQKATEGGDYRWWIPLLGLYTGARLNEISQLHVKDIKKEDGLWCMHFTAKGGTDENPKRLKNMSSERLVPLHEKLIELGFIYYVKSQSKAGAVRLFPDLIYSKTDGYSRKIGRWFNDSYLRKKLKIFDRSFHSFRHTVADHLKQKGVEESYIAELLGHASGETMSFGRYGKRYQPRVLMEEAVFKFKFDLKLLPTSEHN